MAHQNYILFPLPSLISSFLSLFVFFSSHPTFFFFFLPLSPMHCLISASSRYKLAQQNGLSKISDERADLSRARVGSMKPYCHSQPKAFWLYPSHLWSKQVVPEHGSSVASRIQETSRTPPFKIGHSPSIIPKVEYSFLSHSNVSNSLWPHEL